MAGEVRRSPMLAPTPTFRILRRRMVALTVVTANASPTEACDDGNRVDGDGCNATCTEVEGGFLCEVPGQPCVDLLELRKRPRRGRRGVRRPEPVSGDGCNGSCRTEAGWACPAQGGRCRAKDCGDGIIAGDEECDDGNADRRRRLRATCRLEAGYTCATPASRARRTTCGDGITEGTEQCDDGNNDTRRRLLAAAAREEPRCPRRRRARRRAATADPAERHRPRSATTATPRAGDGCSPHVQARGRLPCVLIEQVPPARRSPSSTAIVYRGLQGHRTCRAATSTSRTATAPETGHRRGRRCGAERPEARVRQGGDHAPNTTHGRARVRPVVRGRRRTSTRRSSTLRCRCTARQTARTSSTTRTSSRSTTTAAGWPRARSRAPGTWASSTTSSFTSEAALLVRVPGRRDAARSSATTTSGCSSTASSPSTSAACTAPESGSVDAGAAGAPRWACDVGRIYEIAVFQAERHTDALVVQADARAGSNRRAPCAPAICGDGIVDARRGVRRRRRTTAATATARRGCLWGRAAATACPGGRRRGRATTATPSAATAAARRAGWRLAEPVVLR